MNRIHQTRIVVSTVSFSLGLHFIVVIYLTDHVIIIHLREEDKTEIIIVTRDICHPRR